MPSARRLPSPTAVRSLQRTMLRLGFTGPSIEAYLRLLLQGRRTSTQLRTEGALEEAQLHDVVQELFRAGLVVQDRTSSKTYWYCADPAIAWLSLAAEVTWTAVGEIAPVDALPDTGVKDVDERSALLRSAVRPAIQLWCGDRPRVGISRSAHNSGALAQLAVEAVQIAQVRIRSVSASPKVSGAAKFWAALVARMQAGVAYTRLTDLDELYEHGLEVVRRDLTTGVDLRVGLHEELAQFRGYLADRKVMVRYDEAHAGERPASGFMTSDRNAIDRFVRRFERVAADCVRAESALTHLDGVAEKLRGQAISLSGDAGQWLDEMIRVGKFANLPTVRQWEAEHVAGLESELTAAGLVARVADGGLLPVWPDALATTQFMQANR